ncbi:hypothetical protein GmRootV512_39720 [Variovorax sp. V512]
MNFDGQSPPPGVAAQGAGQSSSRLRIAAGAPQRAVSAEFNGERLTGRAGRRARHATVLELTY